MVFSRFIPAMLILAMAAFTAPAPAQAQDFEPAVIAFVDMDRVLQTSEAGKSIQAQLEAQRQSFGSEAVTLQQQLRSAEEELRRQQAILSQEAFQAQVRDFEQEAVQTQRRVQTKQAAIQQGFNNALNQLVAVVQQVTAELAEERGIELVLTRTQLLLASKELDLTDPVLARVNERLPDVKVEIPEIPEGAAE